MIDFFSKKLALQLKKKGKQGLKTVSKDTKLGPDEYEAESLTKFGKGMDKTLLDKEKAIFKAQGTIKMRKSDSDGIHGTTVNKNDTAKIAALKAKGYVQVSESFDSTNMPEHAPEVVEMTPDAYDYYRSSWLNALSEVNRYKGKSGHRVTQPDKSGDEHIVMQLRKAITIGANHTGVKFKDGETHKISAKTAQKHLDHYSSLKPEDKIKWQNSASDKDAIAAKEMSEKSEEKLLPTT